MTAELKTKDDIYRKLVEVLCETFECKPEQIRLETNLYKDLEIDSIDAIDLLVKLQHEVGKRLQPDTFKNARTVQEIVDAVAALVLA